jgi:CheY-like chemotaxis protein
VEDERNARGALLELLREEGFRVDEAASGLEALPKLAAFQPDLVLTDLRMPGMGGMELLRHARAANHAPAIVVMTGQGSPDSAVQAMVGVWAYLTKPIDFAVLPALLDQALSARRAGGEG